VTNFPTSVDTFTNPDKTDQINSTGVPHSQQHTNLNDAVLAIENFLIGGVGPSGAEVRLLVVSGVLQLQLKDQSGGGTPWHRVYLESVDGLWTFVIDQTGQA